ncbi:cardioacceleratory peptide receptor-like [Babylonia areolata]|uniref:cardioacceleratory peptide receptor-like n=1 Tax=Babylonia areolata TaxID=304850 RepID=UPI003FCF9249
MTTTFIPPTALGGSSSSSRNTQLGYRDSTGTGTELTTLVVDVTTAASDLGDTNVTTGGNSTVMMPLEVEFYKDAQMGFLVVLFLVIVLGNAIVLAAICMSRERRKSRMNFFIMHLAICDMLTGPLVVLSDLIQKFTTYWYAGDALCRIHKFTQVSVMYASTYMLVALSIDRLDAVARPMHFSGSWLRAKILVGTAWLLSLVFAIPELVLFKAGILYGGPMCMIDLTEAWQWQAYLTPIAVTLFIIPAFIICICYVIIITIIWRSSHLLRETRGSRHRGKHREEELLNGRSSPRSGQSEFSRSSSRGIIPQAKIRTIKMTFLIVLVFIVCWSPYFIFNLCQVYGVVPDTLQMHKLSTFIQSMAPLNSAANPVIYGVFSTRICKYLRRAYLFRRISEQVCQCCHDDSPGPTSGTDYTSMTDTQDLRLSSGPELRAATSGGGGGGGSRDPQQDGGPRIPYVKQRISEADRALLSMHVRTQSQEL